MASLVELAHAVAAEEAEIAKMFGLGRAINRGAATALSPSSPALLPLPKVSPGLAHNRQSYASARQQRKLALKQRKQERAAGRAETRAQRGSARRARLGGSLREVAQPTIDSAGATLKTSVGEAVDDGVKTIRSAADDAGRDLRANVRRESTRSAFKLGGGLAAGIGVGGSAPVALHHALGRKTSSERDR